MESNGKSPTAQTIDEITIDLNRVSRLTFREFWRIIQECQPSDDNPGDPIRADEETGAFIERVVTGWPFGEISKDAYLTLGMLDSKRVDDALQEAMEIVSKKKSSLSSKPPENSNGA